jgi:hypothetical protein
MQRNTKYRKVSLWTLIAVKRKKNTCISYLKVTNLLKLDWCTERQKMAGTLKISIYGATLKDQQ